LAGGWATSLVLGGRGVGEIGWSWWPLVLEASGGKEEATVAGGIGIGGWFGRIAHENTT